MLRAFVLPGTQMIAQDVLMLALLVVPGGVALAGVERRAESTSDCPSCDQVPCGSCQEGCPRSTAGCEPPFSHTRNGCQDGNKGQHPRGCTVPRPPAPPLAPGESFCGMVGWEATLAQHRVDFAATGFGSSPSSSSASSSELSLLSTYSAVQRERHTQRDTERDTATETHLQRHTDRRTER